MDGDTTIETILTEFYGWLRLNGARPATIRTHHERILLFVSQCGIIAISEISTEAISRWMSGQLGQSVQYEDHPYRPALAKPLSPVTVRERLKSLQYFVDFCLKRGHLAADPLADLPTFSGRRRVSVADKMMRPEALLRMLAAARREAEAGSPRNLALLSFMADTGVRVGEAVSVRLADLDLERRTAVVRGKTETREVDFTPECGDAIRAWLKLRPGGSPFLFVGLGNRSRGKQMTTNAVRIVFAKLAQVGEAEGPTNPHALCHLVGQTWVDATNARLAQAKLGHSQLQTTLQYYYRVDRQRIVQETRRLSFLLLGADEN